MAEKCDSLITEPMISIGTLANKMGISVSTIRKYESEGLIISHRSESGHRLYSLEDMERIQAIQRSIQMAGLNMEGIRRIQAMIPCWKIFPCSQTKKKQCPAAADNTKPCWMIKDLDCGTGEQEKCRLCLVYRFGSSCIEDIKDLVYGRHPGGLIKEKMEKHIKKNTIYRKEG